MILNGLNIDEWKNENERLRAEIADLRRQLREPPAIGFYPESGRCVWDQKALDAYVQEKVDRLQKENASLKETLAVLEDTDLVKQLIEAHKDIAEGRTIGIEELRKKLGSDRVAANRVKAANPEETK